MSRDRANIVLLGLCLGLAACDGTPSGDITGPESPISKPAAATAGTAALTNYIVIHPTTRIGIAYDINKLGQVVGEYSSPIGNGNSHAFLWQDGVLQDLGTLGGTYSRARAINAAGQVVGNAALPEDMESHAFLWEKGAMRDLGTLGVPGGALSGELSDATAINAQGQIVGWSYTAQLNRRAFFWEDGQMRRLQGLESFFSRAFSIDNNGRVVGEFGGSATRRGFHWKNGTVWSIVSSDEGTAIPAAINDEDKVVGSLTSPSGSLHGFVWRGGVMTDLGSLGGNTSATAINGTGTIVGVSQNDISGPSHAFIWKSGVMSDLGPGAAYGINRDGWVVGWKIDPAVSGHTGFTPTLWKPTDNPPPPPTPGLVRVGGTFFASARNGTWNPAVDTVAVGTTVTWDWFGGTHSVRSQGLPSFTSSAAMSGADGLYTFTFTQTGTYQYDCGIHGRRMSGRVVVK